MVCQQAVPHVVCRLTCVCCQANLLVIDSKLLLGVASEVMGGPQDRLDGLEEGNFSLSAFLLSLWLSGACIAALWAIILYSWHSGQNCVHHAW